MAIIVSELVKVILPYSVFSIKGILLNILIDLSNLGPIK